MIKAYYEASIKDDLANYKKIEKFDKREKLIATGAGLLGIASFGIMKAYGYDDLVSNYPLMAYWALTYLEGRIAYKRLMDSKYRLDDLMSYLADNKAALLNELMNTKPITSTFVSKVNDTGLYSTIDDYYIRTVDNIGLVSEEEVRTHSDTDKSYQVLAYTPDEADMIRKTR